MKRNERLSQGDDAEDDTSCHCKICIFVIAIKCEISDGQEY